MSQDSDALRPTPPPPAPRRSALRRYSRWLLPVIALGVAPLPVALALTAAGVAAWVAVRRIQSARARASALAEADRDRDRVQLGHEPSGRSVSLDDHQLGAHALILGASGSGKSTTLLSITTQQIAHGRPVVVIDLKGSREFADQLGAAAAAAGRPFRVWTPDGAEHWNPLAHGNATELKDKLISTERFSEPHYQRAAERYVQTALSVHAEVNPGQPATLATVVDLLEPSRLKASARRLETPRRLQVDEYLRSLGPDQVSAVRGLQSRLAIISESHTGAFLESAPGSIDLRHALNGPEVILFSLNASSYGRLSAQLGALVVQDLVSVAGARERSDAARVPATVAIDEFSALGADQVMSLIARGRSAGVSVLLATQELADLDRVARGFREQVLGSTAVKIAHRQDGPESALEVARLAGSEQVWEASYSSENGGRGAQRINHRLVERTRVDPSTVQSLGTGEAVVITKLPRSETRLTQMTPLGLGLGREPGRRRGRDGPGR